MYECLECNTTVSWLRGVFVAVAPDNPQSLVHSGAHSFRIEGSVQREEVQVTVMVRTAPAVPSAGVIDLHLYFTGAYDWSADVAPQTQYFRDVMNRVEEVWEPMGLRIGEMTFTDLDPAYQNVENAWGPGNDLDALLAQSGDQTPGALNVFFVDELYVGDSREPREADPIIGISAAPGPPRVDGTISSGIVVSTWSTLSVPEAERWPNALAHTIAHEAGHYFGLRHTTEFDGVTHDRLDDTPEGDRGNLMHADPDPERGTLSPWQARIILGNMLVAPP